MLEKGDLKEARRINPDLKVHAKFGRLYFSPNKKGWEGESFRHSLSRMGIKTGKKPSLVVLPNGKFKFTKWNKNPTIGGTPSSKFTYNVKNNVGKAKYLVTYYQGKQTHDDGSEFGDIKIFHNKKDLAKFEKELKSEGYRYG